MKKIIILSLIIMAIGITGCSNMPGSPEEISVSSQYREIQTPHDFARVFYAGLLQDRFTEEFGTAQEFLGNWYVGWDKVTDPVHISILGSYPDDKFLITSHYSISQTQINISSTENIHGLYTVVTSTASGGKQFTAFYNDQSHIFLLD